MERVREIASSGRVSAARNGVAPYHAARKCNELCTKGDADVHHLVPRAVGGMDERSAVMVVKRHNAGFCCERTARRFVLR